MSRIADELDAAAEGVEEPVSQVGVASGRVGVTTRAIAELAEGAGALEAVRAALAAEGAADAREVRIVWFEREHGARVYAGRLEDLLAGAVAWEPPLEASYRGHELYLPRGAGAEPMALALALAGELPPFTKGDDVAKVAACVGVARRAVLARDGEPIEALFEPESLDDLLEALENAPAPPLPIEPGGVMQAQLSAPGVGGFGVVAVDREGSLCAATAGDAPVPPVVALRFGRAFFGVVGRGSAEALLVPLVRLVDYAAPADALLEGLEALDPGDLAFVVRDDDGRLEARAGGRGAGSAAVQWAERAAKGEAGAGPEPMP